MATETERDYPRAWEDRQRGVMPTNIQRRPDALPLWAAFRRHVGIAWTGQTLDSFVAGWDAASTRGERT